MWVKHLQDPQARKDFEGLLRNNVQLFTRLEQILVEELDKITRSETNSDDFSDPNWSHKQAFRNGSKAQLSKLTELIQFIKKA